MRPAVDKRASGDSDSHLALVGDASVLQTNEDSASSLAVRRIPPAFVVLILARRRVETGLFPDILARDQRRALKSISSTQFARFAARGLEHAYEFFRNRADRRYSFLAHLKEEIKVSGLKLTHITGGIYTGEGTRAQILELGAHKGVVAIELSRPLYPDGH